MSPPEGKVWHRLRYGLGGVEWHAQAIILGWIADFFCPQKRIVVEVDSSFHRGREKQDRLRDEVMTKHGITVIRVEASDINRNINAVLLTIIKITADLPDNPWPADFGQKKTKPVDKEDKSG